MSAPPLGTPPPVPGEAETRRRLRALLGAVTSALLEEQPALHSFADHRPARDRSSGSTWHGAPTYSHVSALLASTSAPAPGTTASERLLGAADAVAHAHGLHRRSQQVVQGVSSASWAAGGDLLEVIVGVRVGVRAISAPFLPDAMRPTDPTGPPAAISPLTPPPRLVR